MCVICTKSHEVVHSIISERLLLILAWFLPTEESQRTNWQLRWIFPVEVMHSIICFEKCALCWMPPLLTAEHKEKRFRSVLLFLPRTTNKAGNTFLRRTRLEMKAESVVTLLTQNEIHTNGDIPDSPPPKQIPSGGESDVDSFFRLSRCKWVHAVWNNAASYCETFNRLRKAIGTAARENCWNTLFSLQLLILLMSQEVS